MKVLILSTFGHYGGAAVCAKRHYLALKKHGLDVDLRVVQFYDDSQIRSIFKDTFLNRLKIKLSFIMERLQVLFNVSHKKYLYKFSVGSGLKLSTHPLVEQADIIHLHWINFGFISIREIARLSEKKKVFWTQHDMWSFTGGCHYALDCEKYQNTCDDCFYLKNSRLSKDIQTRKTQSWSQNSFKLLTTSNWLAQSAGNSTVFSDWNIKVLPTPIDTNIYKPLDKGDLKEEYHLDPDDFYILFGAVDLKDERKGFSYLLEALSVLKESMPNMHLLTFGKQPDHIFDGKATSMGQISSEEKLNEIYNLADVFVLPSIQDNLPNTVMEAMSCGLPVVAFDCGGVSDMVDHLENGFLAPNMDSRGLTEGIIHFQDKKRRVNAGIQARQKVERFFSEDVLVPKYKKFYNESIHDKS